MPRIIAFLFIGLFFSASTALAGFIPEFFPVWQKGDYSRKSAGATSGGKTFTDPATGMEFVFVRGGCFMMGSNDGANDMNPVHEVCVDDFWLGKFEVTNSQYRRYKSDHDSKDYQGNSLNGDQQPAVYVSWDDAVAYARWLAGKSGKAMRLPTEAEWEYAARAGKKTERWWGDSLDKVCRNANVADQSAKRKLAVDTIFDHDDISNCDDGYAVTAPVGKFAPNGFGLYDMFGNVWEWTSDWYDDTYYAQSPRNNPQGPSRGSLRVYRGGGWYQGLDFVQLAHRRMGAPDDGYFGLGFRLAFPAKEKGNDSKKEVVTGARQGSNIPQTNIVTMTTSLGVIVLELDAKKAPESVANFLRYVDEGFYDGTIFHRVIANFMIQGGGFAADREKKNGHAPIRNEAGNGLRNQRGTIAMARTNDVNSATSQFFINVIDNDFLNHKDETARNYGYAVFGRIIEGMEVVDRIATAPTRNQDSAFANLPVATVTIESARRGGP